MRGAVLSLCLALFPCLVLGQGTIQFANLIVGVVDYPISDCYGPLTGPGWTAQLWGAPFGTAEENLSPLLPTTTFRTDTPGYVLPVTVTALEPGGLAAVQIRVWNNEDNRINAFADATVRAVSPVVQVRPGGWGLPPTVPAYLDQLGDVPLLFVQSPGCELPTNQCCFTIGFSLTNIVIAESQKSFRISVSRNKLVAPAGPAGPEQTVSFAFEDVTAHSGQNYQAQAGTLSFTSPSSGWIPAEILDDPSWSGSRTFRVRLFDPGETVMLGRNSVATVTIADDDTVLSPRRGIDGPIRVVLAVPESKWLIGGDFTTVDGYHRGRIARLELDGTIDPAFDPGAGANGPVFSVVRQPDGKFIVGGGFTSFAGADRAFFVRLDQTGPLDPTFTSAIAPANPAGGLGASALRHSVVQTDGKILVAGAGLKSGPIANSGVLRLNSDGSLDPGFLPPVTLTNATVLGVQSDGKVLVGADNGFREGSLVRLHPDGSHDPSFNADLTAIPSRAVRGVSALAVLPNGQVLVGGMLHFSGGDLGLLVLEPSGQPAAKQVSLALGSTPIAAGFVTSMAWQSKDTLLIAGGWEIPFNGSHLCCLGPLIRLHSDLNQDQTFSPSQDAPILNTFSLQADGTIGGIQPSYPQNRLQVLEADGNPMENLHFSGIARLPDGQIHLALRGASPWSGYLQVSSDLVRWQTITNSVLELQGRVFRETVLTNASPRFYRVASSP